MKHFKLKAILTGFAGANLFAGISAYDAVASGNTAYRKPLQNISQPTGFDETASLIAYSPVQSAQSNIAAVCAVPYFKNSLSCRGQVVYRLTTRDLLVTPPILIAAALPVAQFPGAAIGMIAARKKFDI